jgi:sugar phosphate isomerase/epimerase
MNRREFIAAMAAVNGACLTLAAASAPSSSIGICTFSCNLQWQAVRSQNSKAAFSDVIGFYDYVRSLGANGVQTSFRELDPQQLKRLRGKSEKDGAYLEGDLRLPKSTSELADFENEVRLTREVGASVARTTLMGGRRYEVFKTIEEFREFHRQAKERLMLVEPILARHGLKLAVENHKDLTLEEQLTLIKQLSSEWIGVLVDTGNNIALLDEPDQVVESLAPYALSVHLKDMAVQPDARGFLLSEVPCGTGLLDLTRMIKVLRAANSSIVFNLEMATRDPLLIPCQTDKYWVTFPDRKSSHLEAALAMVKQNPLGQLPPSIVGKSLDRQLLDEEDNNRLSLSWMRQAIL